MASLSGADVPQGFGGARIHAVQIGLGTFGTFIQNLAGNKSDWDSTTHRLLRSTSEASCENFNGVAVEPVRDHVLRLRPLLSSLPGVRVVQTTLGQVDQLDGEEDIYVLTAEAHAMLLENVPSCLREQFSQELVYLRTMSCVGKEHPFIREFRSRALDDYGVDIPMEPIPTDVWSYGRLADCCDFCGCELLLIDAEGHDVEILRSMIKHCREREAQNECAWPDLIVFETMGHCDRHEGSGAEGAMIRESTNGQRCLH